MDVFAQLTLALILAFSVATFMVYLKQPLLVGYIIAGIIVGPYGLNLITSKDTIELFSKLGITALLFIVGLNLSPKVIKEVGKVSLITGVAQVIFTTFIGYIIISVLGFKPVEALYISLAITFSSTIIILKLLSDKGDTQKLYAKITIGFLLVQDLIATIVLVILSSISSANESGGNIALAIVLPLLKGFIALAIILGVGHKILPRFTNFFAKSGELLYVFSLAWGIGIGLFYNQLGLSIEIGALVAGVALSMTPYAYEISSRLKPLRDFFIVLFFINLGNNLVFANIAELIIPTIVISLFILIGNPIIMFVLLNLMGYTKRTSFFTGLTVGQISEFSLILVALGLKSGYISQNGSALVTMVGIITIALSSYLIIYSKQIYRKISPVVGLFLIRKKNHDALTESENPDAVLFGCHRIGIDFIKSLEDQKINFLVVDHNPNIIKVLNGKNINAIYGDADDIEFLSELRVDLAKIIISTIPDFETNLFLTEYIRKSNQNSIIIVISDHLKESQILYDSGATYVIMPHYVGANIAASMIQEFGSEYEKYHNVGLKHLAYLKRRTEITD